ncbi:MAG: hypothetical protein COB77_01665 [Gammaproteobacteria bacterium]|nr:MAG: hypothetical protein COB77_01665 [Gammaproteobacteria bacterium]
MDEIILILLILAGIWYWWGTQRCNEVALAVCRQKCNKANLQLLDATVIRQRTWLRRDIGGTVQICRLYSFEYTAGVGLVVSEESYFGAREQGYIVLIGKQVVETHLSHSDG